MIWIQQLHKREEIHMRGSTTRRRLQHIEEEKKLKRYWEPGNMSLFAEIDNLYAVLNRIKI